MVGAAVLSVVCSYTTLLNRVEALRKELSALREKEPNIHVHIVPPSSDHSNPYSHLTNEMRTVPPTTVAL